MSDSITATPGREPREPAPGAGLSTEPGTLKRLALRGSLFEIAGLGASMAVRLGGNMVVSRLLFPSAFGLMALVTVFMQGLVMLSDMGIEPAVIQSERGDEVAYLDTAWTIQALRGLVLYAVVLLLAWPMAMLYQEPQLFGLMCVGSLALVVQGLSSTSFYTLRRKLQVGTINLIELGAQLTSLVVMVVWAWKWPSVWTLVGGHLVAYVFKAVASHAIAVGYRNRFRMDPRARQAIVHFGKWVFGSSAFYFLGRQADRLLLARFLGVADLGVYSIAVLLSEAIAGVITRLAQGVLFPILSRVHVEGPARVRALYYRARLPLDALALPVLGVLTALGPWLIHVLYDSRYAAAGWILQAFAVRVAMSCLLAPCETLLISMGLSRYSFYLNLARFVWVLLGVPLGWYAGGMRGIVLAVAASEVPVFFVLWPASRAQGMLRLLLELRALGMFAGGVLVGWLLSGILHT